MIDTFDPNTINKKNFENFFWSITFIFLLFFALVFNPFYVLILCVFFEQIKRQPKILFWVISSSIVLSIANREIGGGWGTLETGFANDDAIIYLDSYISLKSESYIGNPSEYIYKYFNGQEPGWFVLMELVGFFSNFNVDLMLLISVAMPIFIIHYAIYRSFKYPLFVILVFYFISTEIIHSFYHLWRFSLALSLSILVIMVWNTNKNFFKRGFYYIFPSIAHITILAPMFLLFISDFFKSKKIQNSFGFLSKLKFSIFLMFSIVALSILLSILLAMFEYTKVMFYFTGSSGEPGGLNPRFILQLLICIFLIVVTRKPLVFIYTLSAASVLILPYLIDLSFIFIRLAVIFTPIVSLFFCLEIENRKTLTYMTIIGASLIFIRLALNSGDIGHYQYMAQGNFFSFTSGLLYNLFGVIGYE